MSIVAPPLRLASASVVLFGQRGDITQHAQDRGVSRQRLYREAASVLRDLDQAPAQQLIDRLHQQLGAAQEHLRRLQDQQRHAVLVTAEVQAEFASTAQAEGVSLPVCRRLLAPLLAKPIAELPVKPRQPPQRGATGPPDPRGYVERS